MFSEGVVINDILIPFRPLFASSVKVIFPNVLPFRRNEQLRKDQLSFQKIN